jgi:hypothetical protein
VAGIGIIVIVGYGILILVSPPSIVLGTLKRPKNTFILSIIFFMTSPTFNLFIKLMVKVKYLKESSLFWVMTETDQ